MSNFSNLPQTTHSAQAFVPPGSTEDPRYNLTLQQQSQGLQAPPFYGGIAGGDPVQASQPSNLTEMQPAGGDLQQRDMEAYQLSLATSFHDTDAVMQDVSRPILVAEERRLRLSLIHI